MKAQHLVAYAHLTCIKVYILQTGYIVHCQRHILLNKSGSLVSADHLIIRKTAQPDIAGVIDDTLELFDTLHELYHHLTSVS